jgi:hypothetical protein
MASPRASAPHNIRSEECGLTCGVIGIDKEVDEVTDMFAGLAKKKKKKPKKEGEEEAPAADGEFDPSALKKKKKKTKKVGCSQNMSQCRANEHRSTRMTSKPSSLLPLVKRKPRERLLRRSPSRKAI